MDFEGRIALFVVGLYLLCMSQQCCASEYTTIRRTAVVGQELHLVCPLQNSSGDVTWYAVSSVGFDIFIVRCNGNVGWCSEFDDVAEKYLTINVTSNETISILMFRVDISINTEYKCKVSDQIKLSFLLTIVRLEDVGQPLCTISPTLGPDGNDVTKINHLCINVNAIHDIDQSLKILQNNETVVYDTSTDLNYTVDYDENDQSLISCEMEVQGIIRYCHFPRRVQILSRLNNDDIEFNCVVDEQVSRGQIIWRLLELDGEVDITNRSWTREEGRSMLLTRITERDRGRVIECSVHPSNNSQKITSTGFYVINIGGTEIWSTISGGDIQAQNHNNHKFKILFAVFFIMWVLTVGMISAWYMYPKTKSHWHPSRVSSCFSRRGKQRSEGEGKENAQGMSERKADADSGERRPNQNNSSSNDISKGGQGNSGPSIPDQGADDLQQGDGNKCVDNPVYFCVDRSPATIRSSWKSSQANHAKDVESDNDYNDLDPNDYDYVIGLPHTNDMHGALDSSVYADVRTDLEPVLYGKVKK